MKCFVHANEEAIAVCKKCGKAMCATCSAYGKHSGVCPECKRIEFEEEVKNLEYKVGELKWAVIGNAILTILLCWTLIFGIIFGVRWYLRKKEKTECEWRIASLKNEIKKLKKAESERSTKTTL